MYSSGHVTFDGGDGAYVVMRDSQSAMAYATQNKIKSSTNSKRCTHDSAAAITNFRPGHLGILAERLESDQVAIQGVWPRTALEDNATYSNRITFDIHGRWVVFIRATASIWQTRVIWGS
jgi:hypothetical protein